MKTVKTVVAAALAAYFVFLVVTICRNPNRFQWDFKTHYYAAKVHSAGLNYYDRPYLKRFAKSPVQQFYSYTPASIYFFHLFALVDYRTGYVIFLGFKLAVLLGLGLIWRNIFLDGRLGLAFAFFALFAFNGALYVDLLAGNISLVEQLGLWLGFAFLLKKRYAAFCLCVVLVSIFKIVPLLFLGLLFLVPDRRKFLHLAGSGALFLALQFASALIDPYVIPEFFRVFFGMLEETRSITNPSSYVLAGKILAYIKQLTGWAAPRAAQLGLWLGFAALVAGLTGKAWRRLGAEPEQTREKVRLFLICAACALIIPRFKDYSYTLLLAPAWFALKRLAADKGSLLLLLLAVLSIPANANPPGSNILFGFLWDFYPLVLAAGVWALYAAYSPRREGDSGSGGTRTAATPAGA